MNISRLVALAGSVLTLTQALFLAGGDDGLCFSAGCEIVDSLTTVPPLFFNIGGFLFFQAVFWGVWLAKRWRNWAPYINALLLAGLAAEGVLLSFQFFIAQSFCTYCLVVLFLVVLLNVLCGLRHILTGAAVFAAVFLAFASLQFSAAKINVMGKLDTGTFAVLAGLNPEPKHFLFFSSSCKYCENVIALLQEEQNCTISFNPIDEIPDFILHKAQKAETYATDVNRSFLRTLDIAQIPVLLTVNQSGYEIIKGEGPIKSYLQEHCLSRQMTPVPDRRIDFSSSTDADYLLPGMDDSCSVNIDCDEPDQVPPTNQPIH